MSELSELQALVEADILPLEEAFNGALKLGKLGIGAAESKAAIEPVAHYTTLPKRRPPYWPVSPEVELETIPLIKTKAGETTRFIRATRHLAIAVVNATILDPNDPYQRPKLGKQLVDKVTEVHWHFSNFSPGHYDIYISHSYYEAAQRLAQKVLGSIDMVDGGRAVELVPPLEDYELAPRFIEPGNYALFEQAEREAAFPVKGSDLVRLIDEGYIKLN